MIVVGPEISILLVALGQNTQSSIEEDFPSAVTVPVIPISPAYAFGDGYIPVVPSGHSKTAPKMGRFK